MNALVTLRIIFEDRERGLQQLVSAMDYGSTAAIPIQRLDETCEFHEDPKIVEVREIEGAEDNEIEVVLAIPTCLAGTGTGLAMLISSICYCSVFTSIQSYAVIDVQLPSAYLSEFVGPRHGVVGIRELLSVPVRPLLGLILKPRLHMSLPDVLPAVRRALEGGADYIIDDELVVSPRCCPFGKRVRSVGEVVAAAENKMGRKIGYFANATADIDTALNLVDEGVKAGATGFMLNCVAMGFSGVRYVIDRCAGETVFVINNIGRGIITRKSTYYMSESVIALLSRLAGGDAIYTGPLTQDFPYEVEILGREISKLQGELGSLKRCFGISSGSIFLEEILQNVQTIGTDVMIQMGRGLLSDQNRIRSSVAALIHILSAVVETPIKNDIISEFKRIVDGVSPPYKWRAQPMSGKGSLEEKRLRDIVDNLGKDLMLLKRTEDAIRTTDRPKEIQRFDEELVDIRARIADSTFEYEKLSATGQISGIELGKEGEMAREVVAKSFVSTLSADEKTDELKTLLEEATTVLQAFYAVAKNLPKHEDVVGQVEEACRVLDSNVSLADKLKVTIPIIPFLLQYEGEVSLGSRVSVSTIWKKVVTLVQRQLKKRNE